MEDIKKHDWFATLMYNPDLSIRELSELGITTENSGLKTKDEYKNIDAVKETFVDNEGKFDEKKFNDFYNGALELYNQYALDTYDKKIPQLFIDSKWDAPRNAPVFNATPTFTLKESTQADPNAVYYMPSPFDYNRYTPKELAEMEEVVDYKTGESLGWTPEDKGGIFKGLVRPTIVLAAYDEDEFDESGKLIHAKGDLKFNKNGKPYAETLGDRDIRNKQLIAYSDTLTREKSAWNKIDFFDSDDYDKSIGGTLVKMAVTTLPYFIPGVNTVLGGLVAAEQLMRVLPVLGKTINGIATGNSDNSFGKTMNQLEGFWARFDPTVSYKSQENLVTFENFGNLISSISGQLFQQRAVGMLPYLLNGKKNTEGLAKVGRGLSYAYMAATSSQDNYNVFKEAGASDRVAGFATLGSMLAIWKLMQIDYFRDNLFKGTYMDETGTRVPAMNIANQVRDKVGTFIAEGEAVATKQGAAKFVEKMSNFYHNTLLTGIAKGGLPARMLSEATEEVMEETTTDMTKGVVSALNWLGFNVTEENKELNFNWSPEDVLQRYGMAFAGGFIGGGIFAGQTNFENWLIHKKTGFTEPDDMKKLIYYIAEGKGQEIKDFYSKWHKKGLLGSKDLGTTLTTIESISGTKTIAEPTGKGLSQNDVVYNHLINFVDYIEGLVNMEGLGYTRQQIENLRTVGFDVSDKTLKAQTLIDLGAYSMLEDDLWSLAADIVLKNNELQTKLDSFNTGGDTALARQSVEDRINNDADVKRLKGELKELRQKRDDLLAGKLNYKYATQALFITNPSLSDKFVDISKENFVRFKYGVPYNTMSDEQKMSVESEYEDYKKGEGREKILKAADLYYELSAKWGPQIKEAASKLVGLNIDSLHDNKNLGVIQYVKLLTDVSKIENEIKDLRSKETLTPEEQTTLNEKLQELIQLNTKIQSFQANPGRLLANAQLEESEFKELNDLLIFPEFGAEQIQKVTDLLKRMYQKAADDKIVLTGDSELIALYNEIRKQYNTNSAEKRMQSYFDIKANEVSERENNDGVPESSYWEPIMVEKNTDEDEWFTFYPNETSILKTDTLGYLQSFINNFGTNNTVALQAYNNLLNALRTRTNLTESEIKEFLDYVIPQINGNSIVNFINEIDALRARVTYSPIASLLKDFWFDYSGARSNIIDLLENEEKHLSNSPLLTDYIIQNKQVKHDLQDAKSILNILGAILIGSTDKTNSSINAFKNNPKELPVIDRDAAVILGNDVDIITNRINYILDRDEANSNQALKQHERIDKNMRSKFLLAITSDPFVEQFEKLFKYKVGDIDKPINLKEILTEITPANFSFDSIDLIDANVLQDIWIKFEQRVFEEVKKANLSVEETATNLLKLFSPEIWKMTSTRLSDREDEIIQPADLLTYIMTIISVPSNAFYTTYKNTTTSDNFEFAPVFGQEYTVRVATAMMANKGLFNETLKQIKQNANVLFDEMPDEINKAYLKNLSKLDNFFMVFGGGGTGKTVGVAGTIAAMFKDHSSKQFIALAPKKVQAQRLASQLDASYLVKDEFMKSIRGEENIPEYQQDDRIKHVVRTAPSTYLNTIFDKTKTIKVLVIDEVGLFTESELKEISNWAVTNDIFVLGLGDPKQNTALAHVVTQIGVKPDGTVETTTKDELMESGVEDCIYFRAPMLTASLRTENLAKKENFETLDSILYDIWTKYSENRNWGRDDLNNLVPNDIELKYYEGQGVFFGDMLVEDSTDLLTKARTLSTKGKVAIIYDDSGSTKYSGITEDTIKLLPFSDMQGDEYDYVLVDIDFTKHGNGSFATLKNLYTLTQRARIGSFIKKDHITATLSFAATTSDPKLNQEIGVNKDQIKLFKEYRTKALDKVTIDDSFYSYFKTTVVPSTMSPVVSSVVPPVPSTPTPTTPAGGLAPSTPVSSGTPIPTGLNPPTTVPRVSTPGKMIVSTQDIHQFLSSKKFREFEKLNVRSLYNVAKSFKSDVDFKVGLNPNLYNDLVNTLGSSIRTGKGAITTIHPLAIQLRDTIGIETADKILNILSQTPELFIVPYNSTNNMLIARYGNSIEIPVLLVNTKQIGKYTGSIKRLTELKLGEKGTMIPISVFVSNNPGICVFDEQGVVSYDPLDTESIANDSELSNGSKKFLLRSSTNGKTNNGKVFMAMTDEMSEYFEFGDNLWIHPNDGNLISYYNDICLMGIHKPLSIINVAAFVKAIQSGKRGETLSTESLIRQGIWEDSNSPIEVLKSLDWASLPESGTSAFYKELFKRKWQVVPVDRGLVLSRILIESALKTNDFSDILFDLTLFLNTITKPSEKIKSEKHVMILTGKNGKSIYVAPSIVNDNIVGYNVYDYNPSIRSIEQSSLQKISAVNIVPIQELITRFIGSDLQSVQLMRAVTRPDDSKELIDITPNDQLFILLDTISKHPEKLNNLNTTLMQNQEFVNSIYMDDSAGDFLHLSAYFRKFLGDYKNGYVTPVQNMRYSTYELDESKIIPVEEIETVDIQKQLDLLKALINNLNQIVKDATGISENIYDLVSDFALLNWMNGKTSEQIERGAVQTINHKLQNKGIQGRIEKNNAGEFIYVVNSTQNTFEEQIIDIKEIVRNFNELTGLHEILDLDKLQNYLSNYTYSDTINDIVSYYNNLLKFKKNNISGRIVLGDDNNYHYEEFNDSYDYLLNEAQKYFGEENTTSIQILDDSLNNSWNYAIFSVTLSDGSQKIVLQSDFGEIVDFDSYSTFKPILDLYNSNSVLYGPISKYIQGLLTGKGFSQKANKWLIETKEAEQMYMLINNHLMDRLSKKEC